MSASGERIRIFKLLVTISDFHCFADLSSFLSAADFFSDLIVVGGCFFGVDSTLEVRRRLTWPNPLNGSDSPTEIKTDISN